MGLTDAEIRKTIDDYYLMMAYSVDLESVGGGLRPTERACQYFLSDLAPWCKYWDNSGYKCTFGVGEFTPSMYNDGNCDFLGRASKCSQYEATKEADEGYYCIAPNMYLCGLGTKDDDGFLHPIPRGEIKGYNEVDGLGKCDGEGKGTGACGYGGDPDKCAVICNYYRPWRMSFGSLDPQSLESVLRGDPAPKVLGRRLPFTFGVYNLRAKLQRCSYWESSPGQFQTDENGRITIDVIPFDTCTCPELIAWDYLEMSGNSPEWVLDGVWANGANCIVCNGAKPECPFYTGKWLYVVDDKMQCGNKVSAQQMMELRYWLKFWVNQGEYESYFSGIRPNKSDPTTSSIFTFLKWERLGPTASDAIGLGSEVKLLIDPDAGEEDGEDLDGYNFGLINTIKKSEDINGDSMFFIGATVPNATIYLVNTTMAGKYLSHFDDKELKMMLTILIHLVYPSEQDFKTQEFTDNNLEITPVRYQKLGQEIGTKSTQGGGGQVSFPSLIRDISEIYNVDQNKLIDFYAAISAYVRDLLENFPEYIKSASTDAGGFFSVGPIPLKYQTNNKLVLIVEVGDGTWSFQRVDIWSQFYGGLVIQDKFENKFGGGEDGHEDSLPERFSGEAVAEAKLKAITGSNGSGLHTKVGDVTPMSSIYTETTLGPKKFYSYFIKSTACEDVGISEWCRIGFSTRVAAKIDDIKLNYLYFWEVTSAEMQGKEEEDEEEEKDKVKSSETIEMEVIYPSTSSSSGNLVIQPNDDQRYIDPTMFILRPKDDSIKVGFRNSEWELKVTYKYTELVDENPAVIAADPDNDTEGVIWPVFDDKFVFYKAVDFNIEQFENRIIVSNINAKTVGVLASFTDEKGRLMSAVSTKLCTMVTKVFCRGVDIKYRYGSPAIGYKLIPEGGLATYIGGEQVISDRDFVHGFSPPCKDHEYTSDCGFMWYPFQACNDTVVFYTVFAGAGFCTAPYGEVFGEEMYRDDYRFCGPEQYKAFVGEGGGMADCQVKWSYRYSKAGGFPGGSYFSGKANIRGIVNLIGYIFEGWTQPPFGNKGREMISRFMSQEYHGHLSYASIKPFTKYEWMPMIMDNEMFFTSFNAFDETSYIDCFSSYNQLNFYLSDQIEEAYVMGGDENTKERFKFDELFDTRTFIFCSYPYPLNVDGKAVFYQFKNEEHAWAWREIWKDIERGSELLSFVLLDRPPYRLCRDKIYHQYICDEGIYVIKYVAPILKNGVMITYPSITLGGGPSRYFNPLYSEDGYDLRRVEWKDVDGGKVGGESESNIYYVANGGNWNHDEDLLFDSEAVNNEGAAKEAGREFKDPLDEDKTYAYNRGIIVNLYRNSLQYMPFSEKEFSEEGESCVSYSTLSIEYEHIPSNVWNGNVTVTYDISEIREEGACISKVKITGGWGKLGDGTLFCTPGVEIESGADVESATVISQSEFKFAKIAGDSSDWDQYELELELNMTPFRMLDVDTRKRKLFVHLYTQNDQLINVSKMVLYEAEYKNSIEEITVWEQKHVVSKGKNFGDYNLNGPDSTLSFERNMDNSGQYFPAGPNCAYKEETETISKMRSVYAGIETVEDTDLEATLDNLFEIEQEEQEKLYKEAYNLDGFGDNFTYQISMPKYLSGFFENNNINYNITGVVKFICERLEWEKHALYKAYQPGEFWQPKGHKFEWSGDVHTQKCRIGQFGTYIGGIGPVETIHTANFIHMDTQEVVKTMNAAESLRWGRMEYQWQVYLISGQGEPLDAAASPLGVGGTFVDTGHIIT